jgi:hypothetical protein
LTAPEGNIESYSVYFEIKKIKIKIMKSLKLLFLIFICLGLIIGCSKDEALIEESGEMSLKKAHMAPVFVVEPNGVDDTQNLKDAFADAIAAGQGSVVKLVEGEYHIDLIEVFEFHGTLKGAGKGKTVISNVPDVNVDDVLNQSLNTVLLSFVGGDVCVRDLTIHTPAGPLSTGMKPWLHGQLSFSGITAQYVAENEYVKAVVDNVEFISESHVRYGLLAESGFWKPALESVPLADIDISITNCSFSGPYWYGALLMDIRKGNIVVGSQSNGNVFDNCELGIWHNVSVKSIVHSNTFSCQGKWFPLQIVNGRWKTQIKLEQIFQSVCNVEKNIFDVSGSTGAVLINDNRRIKFPDEIPMLVQVKNNKIHTKGGMKTAMACLNVNGAVIRNNKFTGEAEFGVRVKRQAPDIYSENGLMLGNNFSAATYSETPVLLDVGTRNWTIVGGNLGESIWDFGENNLISGFNNNTSDVPFGQTIVDNLQEMKSPMHDFKDH